ncbi:unnamed protein product [Urochloa decumbens]|uniref:BAG domain-containing protein n=1 Tax=Urochloa decumbens TaxID=240449 RepID=A0ABC9A323_9POAL
MYPTNHYMDPYHSYYRNHTPYPYYPPPGWEIPSGHPRAIDSSYRPPTYGPWPYNAGMHHPHPSEFHCCCNCTHPPDYYSFRPPLPQELPPPHLYYHGPFPQHSNACPSYFVPPHPYPVDQMPYGYDKLKNHCCGCPNHVCHGTEKSNVKIEEERRDVKLESDHKDADSGSIIRYPNNQYPFIWAPPGNMEGKENGKCYELSPQLLNGWAPMNRKMTGDVKKQEQDNQLLNGWAPASSKRTGDVKHQEQDNQEEKQFHWPIVWMPAGYDEPKQKAKEMKKMEEAPNNSEEAPRSPKIKIIPLSWFENGHHDQKPATRDGSGDHGDRSAVKSQPEVTDHRHGMPLEGSPKTTAAMPKTVKDERKPARENYKTIPVVLENKIDEKKASTYRTIPVMKQSDDKRTCMSENEEAKKASNADKAEQNGKTKHSESSAAKHSKLPPVCLRVDPFPRKKSGNGSSRSPSPPTRKDGDKAKKNAKEVQGQNLEPMQSDTRHITVSELKEKLPNEMKKGMGSSNETVQAASVEHSHEEEVPTSKDVQKIQASSTTTGTQEDAGAKSLQGGVAQENAGAEGFKECDKRKNEDETVIESEAAKGDARTCRSNLSETDAAVRIQSTYRGYDVRRWQPLDKLRKIRNVHEQMQGVKKQLQCLENSCKKPTEKEQVAIGETIMNLLLKLDTIQGLHPSVRETRKSVARELVCLQEKLDTLCKQPSGEFYHTNSDEEKLERAENVIQTADPTITTEACSKEERAVELGKVEEPSSVDSMEPCDAVPSGNPMEVEQDADASEQKNKKEEPCSTTKEEANEDFGLQVQASTDRLSDVALLEHPTHDQEHIVEESNAVSMEQVTEEKSAVESEGKEVPIVNSMEPLHDAASAWDSSVLKQCMASTQQSAHVESNTGLSSASTEDTNASAVVASVESGVTTEKDGPVDSQVHETAPIESLELKYDVSPAEDYQQRELGGLAVDLEDSLVSLQDEEQHDPIPADDSVLSNTKDQSEAARDISMQEQVVDTMQDSTKEPDGTPEASTNNNIEHYASTVVEKPDQPSLLEQILNSDSALEQIVMDKSDEAVQCGVSGKDEPPHEDQKTEATLDELAGGSSNNGDSLSGTSRKEPGIQESHPNLAEEAGGRGTRDEIVFPELDSCELSCAHEGGITGHERSETEVLSESQTDAQKEHADVVASERDECTEMLKEAPVDASTANSAEDVGVLSVTEKCTEMPENLAEDFGRQVPVTENLAEDAQVGALGVSSAEDVGVQVSVTEKCTEDAPVCAVGANPDEEEADNLKEDIAMQTENKASEEALAAAETSKDGVKSSDEKKLAEENQQLKELLQKLLASGNDQLGVITDLTEKVKALERKLARKKRPKVRVHRPSNHATAKVH